MSNHNQQNIPKRSFRPEERICPVCQRFLKRSHILWRKRLIFLSGPVQVVSWAYRCPTPFCPGASEIHYSTEAESLHLKHRSYSRDLVVNVGYRRCWLHQTMYEIHQWLAEDLKLTISERQVPNVIADFLALLRAAQPAKVRQQLRGLERTASPGLIIGIDGMQPEKGNPSLFVVREAQASLTLMAETLDESTNPTLSERLFEPLKKLAGELGLPWYGVVSDAQESIKLAVAKSLPGVPHQVCQFHCLREAGKPTFEADRSMKKRLKATLRHRLMLFDKRLARLPESDPRRSVLADYADAIRASLLEGGVAPFQLGGLRLYAALEDLAASLARCQKRGTISSYKPSLAWLVSGHPAPVRSLG